MTEPRHNPADFSRQKGEFNGSIARKTASRIRRSVTVRRSGAARKRSENQESNGLREHPIVIQPI
jgi:hypothetical protein